jgi:phosphotransferase system HPr (HPr) family protein
MTAERQLTIADPAGLHAREAARLVRAASRFRSRVVVRQDGREADAKSLIALLGLAVRPSTTVVVAADGEDELEAVEAVALALLPDGPATTTDRSDARA